MRSSCAKAVAVTWLFLAFLASGGASPAWAQGPAPEADTVLLHPDGVVNVQDLPRVGPRVPVHKQMPFLVPDLQGLRDAKAQRGGAKTPPPSATSATVTPAGLNPPLTGLTGLTRSESGGWIPPDTQVGAGPDHIVEAVNLEMRIWTKAGSPVSTSSLNDFFKTTAQLSDPKIRFDVFSGRWFIAAISYNASFTAGAWRLAVSTTSNPTGTFVLYTAATTKSAPDFPALGINEDKVVLTANAFRGNSFLGTEFLVINKAQLVSGLSAASSYFAPPQGLFTIQPALSLSSTCSGSVCALYMTAVAYNSATSIQVWSVTGVPGVALGPTISTKSFALSSPLTSPPDAKQLGTSTLIQTNDNRLLDAAYRDGKLWVSANSACIPTGDTATRACLRLIQFSTASPISKSQDFNFGQPGLHYYYPAISIDSSGNVISVFSGSSAGSYAGVYASGQRPSTATINTLNTFQAPLLIKAGENSYTPFASRWGDYSGASVDPTDQSVVWVAGEYARSEGGSEWGTWIAPLQMSSP